MAMTDRPAVLAAAVVALLVGGWLIYNGVFRSNIRGQTPKQMWFYDVGEGKLYTVAFGELSPTDAPSGPGNGVKAYVFTCGSCSDAKAVYLEKYTPEARQQMARYDQATEAEQQAIFQLARRGTLVARTPDAGQEPQWVSSTSEQGSQIIGIYWGMCGGGPGKACQPK